MYADFYQLKADPFRLSPDHAFCFHYPSFTKAKAYMRYALNAAEGFVLVTGRPGMGKTTLISDLLSDLADADVYLTGMLVNTQLDATPLLRMVAYEFGLQVQDQDKATVLQKLNEFFIKVSQSQRRPLLIVDEAQNLKLEALEELRLLTNLQFQNRPLLQIFLVGQEELRDKLQDPGLEQLRQRITAACHLDPLTVEQTTAYILHRLGVVGWNGVPKLAALTFRIIHQISQGIPRRINQFCSRLLLHGSLEEKFQLSPEDARIVVQELDEEHLSPVVSEHDFLADASNPSTASGDVESCVSDETLLQRAEDLLRQQDNANSKPEPTPHIGATKTSPGEAAGLIKEVQSPPLPTLSEPQIVAPMAARENPGTEVKDETDNDHFPALSRRPVVVYTTVILLIIAIPLLTLPGHHLKKWVPDSVWALLSTPPAADSPAQPQSSNPDHKPRPGVERPATVPDQSRLAGWEFASNPGPAEANVTQSGAGPTPFPIETRTPLSSAGFKLPPTANHREAQPFAAPGAEDLTNHFLQRSTVQQELATPKVALAASLPSSSLAIANAPPTGTDVETRLQPVEVNAPPPLAVQPAAVEKPSTPGVRTIPPHDDQSPLTPPAKMRGPKPLMVREIAFGFDSTEIRPQDRSLLNEVATSMKESNQWMAHIIGYADSVGSKKYNQHLSQLRANVVAAYLSRQGISYDRLRIEGRGSLELLPLQDDTTSGQHSERLVRIVLEPQD